MLPHSIAKGLFMGVNNYIESALKGILKNPILEVLRAINIAKILKQRNFIKHSAGYAPELKKGAR